VAQPAHVQNDTSHRAHVDGAEVTRTTPEGETSNVIDSGFVCENPDCDAFGEAVEL